MTESHALKYLMSIEIEKESIATTPQFTFNPQFAQVAQDALSVKYCQWWCYKIERDSHSLDVLSERNQ